LSPESKDSPEPGGSDGNAAALRDARTELVSVVSELDHPECVAWHDGALFCGTESGDLLRISPPANDIELVASTSGFLLGIAFEADRSCIACDCGQGRLLRIGAKGGLEVIADEVEGRRLVTPNYAVVAGDGTIWVTESGSGWEADNGYLFCLEPGQAPRIVDEECHRYPNGLALDEARSLLKYGRS
jgi:sugar lactone lactonase YvrE